MSENSEIPWADHSEVEKTLKAMWAGANFDQALELTRVLHHFHHKLFGQKWDGIDSGWLIGYLMGERGLTFQKFAKMTFVELASMLRESPDEIQPPNAVMSFEDERDLYILRRKREGATFNKIAVEIATGHQDWEAFDGPQGVYAALKRLCERTGEPYPSKPRKKRKPK
jgi:hypothetical protein